MKVLLDHCVPRRFERLLIGHEVIHTSRLGWGHLTNGKLIAAAEEAGFNAMITVDANLRFQQNLKNRRLSVIVLHSRKNDIPTLTPMANLVTDLLEKLVPGDVVVIDHPNQ